MEEYGLLTKFPPNLYKVYFYQRRDKVLTKFAKLIKVLDFHKILEKSATSLKWKMIKEVFEWRKNDSEFVEERKKILTLGIFMLVLFPNLTRIISLKAAIAFFTYENT